MSNTTDKIAKEITEIINAAKNKGTDGYDTPATVTRIEGGTAWVHIPGGVDETPVKLTISAKEGDTVQVRVAGGTAWIVGNTSAPPTDDDTAKAAQETADSAITVAENTKQEAAALSRKVDDLAGKIGGDSNQYFWHTETGTDTGSHITEKPQDEFLANPSNGGGNTIVRSNGVAIRDGLEELATMSANGVVMGQQEESHATIDYHSLQLTDKDGANFIHFSDLRNRNGVATVVQHPRQQAIDEEKITYYFPALNSPSIQSITISGTTIGAGNYTHEYTGNVNNFVYMTNAGLEEAGYALNNLPPLTSIEITYTTTAQDAKAYTAGNRVSGRTIGPMSFAEGGNVTARGYAAHVEGYNCVSNGQFAHAEGDGTAAYSSAGHAEGRQSYVYSAYAHAEGAYTTARGYASHAEGSYTTTGAAAITAHAEGYGSQATGAYTHAEGQNTTASEVGAHAEGVSTTASGDTAHAEGHSTTAIGLQAHAEGYNTTASGGASHAGGVGTIASEYAQTALGTFNEESTIEGALIIGDGTGDIDRHNFILATPGTPSSNATLRVSGREDESGVWVSATKDNTDTTISMGVAAGDAGFNRGIWDDRLNNWAFYLDESDYTAIHTKDSADTTIPLIHYNGTNIWIGAEQTSDPHHTGATYISSGYDGANDKPLPTIYISVPNADNTGATNYGVLHKGLAPDTTTTISQIIAVNSDNATISSASYAQWGKTAQLYVVWKNKSAISVPASGNVTNVDIGTLVAGKRPAIRSAAHSDGDVAGQQWYNFGTGGVITLGAVEGTGAARTIAANTEFRCYATYILA